MGPDWNSVKSVSLEFLKILQLGKVPLLHLLVTPESLSAFGTFHSARKLLLSIPQPGIGEPIRRAHDAVDVAYVMVLRNAAKGWSSDEPVWTEADAIVTMVWREQLGGWRVHWFGREVLPDQIPRTSIGTAPDHD